MKPLFLPLTASKKVNQIGSFGLVEFYGTSNIVGYLKPNLFLFVYIKYMIYKHILYIPAVKWSNSSISNNSI